MIRFVEASSVRPGAKPAVPSSDLPSIASADLQEQPKPARAKPRRGRRVA